MQKLGNGGKISIRGFFFFLFFPNAKMRKWRKNSYKRFLFFTFFFSFFFPDAKIRKWRKNIYKRFLLLLLLILPRCKNEEMEEKFL